MSPPFISPPNRTLVRRYILTYVLVQLYLWFKLYFLLFLDMEIYDNEFETKEDKINQDI